MVIPKSMNFKIRLTTRDGRDGCLVVTLLLLLAFALLAFALLAFAVPDLTWLLASVIIA